MYLYHLLRLLITTVLILALAWLTVSTALTLTGHTEALHDIGTTLIDIIKSLLTQPIHDLAP